MIIPKAMVIILGICKHSRQEVIEMTYEQAIEVKVTAKEARKEIAKHGFTFEEFAGEVGYKSEYLGSEVLNWLGY